MNCNKAQELISLYLDNKLSSQSMSELKKHFEMCEKCKKDYIVLQNIKNILSKSPKKELSLNFTSSVMNKIKNKNYEKQDNIIMFGSFFNSMKKKLIIAAGFLFVVASSYFFFMPYNNVNKQDTENYASAVEYYFNNVDNYNQNYFDDDDYEEYMLSMFC